MMRKLLFSFVFISSISISVYAQNSGIGTVAPDPSAILDLKSDTKGLLLPRMSTTSINAITNPAKWLVVYDTVQNLLLTNTGTPLVPVWTALNGGGTGWTTNGNTITAGQYLGSSNNASLIVKTNNTERLRVDSLGNVGIGLTSPTYTMHIRSILPQLAVENVFSGLPSSIIFTNQATTTYWGMAAYNSNTTPFGLFNIYNSFGGGNLAITGIGNVGIGTSTPVANLDIHGASTLSNPELQLFDNTQDNYSRMRFSNAFVAGRYWDIAGVVSSTGVANDKLNIYNNSVGDIFSINGNGRVGIGTISPVANLEVKKSVLSTLQVSSASYFDTTRIVLSNKINNSAGTDIWFTSAQESGLVIGSQSDLSNNTTPTIMHLTPQGNVGIGIYSPTNKLQVNGNQDIKNGGLLAMYKTTGLKTLEMSPAETAGEGAVIALYNGSGTRTIDIDADFGVSHRGRIILDEIQINGGSDFAEEFTMNSVADDKKPLPGMLVSIDPDHDGQLNITSEAFDKKIAGVVSGANGIAPGMVMSQKGTLASGDVRVALNGRVYVLATNEGGEIAPGDFITSSSTKGYAMKAKNLQDAQGALIGKAMSKRDAATGYVLVLVNLQ